jgi:ubiquinone/menaquinone biosynthesis C-methylase UbiE
MTHDVALVKETVRRHWAGRASDFDQAPNHGLHSAEQHDAWLAHVRNWAGPGPIDALDVGCGTGFFALLLAEAGHRAVGVDAVDEMLALARAKADAQNLPVRLERADADSLAFDDASFDLIVERHVIWTLHEPTAALREWRRVLRPGGRVVLAEGDWKGRGASTSRLSEDYAPIRDALPLFGGSAAERLAAVAEEAGLELVEIQPLMDAVLWGGPPTADRYALVARRA